MAPSSLLPAVAWQSISFARLPRPSSFNLVWHRPSCTLGLHFLGCASSFHPSCSVRLLHPLGFTSVLGHSGSTTAFRIHASVSVAGAICSASALRILPINLAHRLSISASGSSATCSTVGRPLKSSALPPPWLLPPSAPPWVTIMAVAWVPPAQLGINSMECNQQFKWLIIAMICPLFAGAPSSMSKRDSSCPKENLNITGGTFVLSKGYSHGSLLRYICPNGHYPSVQSRLCQEGHWTSKTKTRKTPECKSDKVTYRCESPLTLIGSKVRVCLDGGQWSGTEPQCYADFTYDTPKEASEAFSSSLKSSLAVSQQYEKEDQQGKKITMNQGGKLDIYIAVDASGSIYERDFENAKTTIKMLIEKISYYPVSPNYEILIFATYVTRIISMRDFKNNEDARNLMNILKELDDFNYEHIGEHTGTNIAKVYTTIFQSMKIEELNNATTFSETQHIVILFTDGQANMGGDPKRKVNPIKHLVTKNDPMRERNLGLENKRRAFPWLAQINIQHPSTSKGSNCMGSLVSSSYILTGATCFKEGDTPDKIIVKLEKGLVVKVKKYTLHPKYNPKAKQHIGIQEYYEFDVALIQLEKAVEMSFNLRPICIPCTRETNGALKLSESEGTCRKHEEILLNNELVEAAFTSDMDNDNSPKYIKNIMIKLGKYRDACVEDAKKAEGLNVKNAREVVTDNFLCSGGNEPKTDDVACK
ncbi:hypothetical protein cypCar_00039108, partial [Cyprinus carpio]